jgi:hypothetical protein
MQRFNAPEFVGMVTRNCVTALINMTLRNIFIYMEEYFSTIAKVSILKVVSFLASRLLLSTKKPA